MVPHRKVYVLETLDHVEVGPTVSPPRYVLNESLLNRSESSGRDLGGETHFPQGTTFGAEGSSAIVTGAQTDLKRRYRN